MLSQNVGGIHGRHFTAIVGIEPPLTLIDPLLIYSRIFRVERIQKNLDQSNSVIDGESLGRLSNVVNMCGHCVLTLDF